MAAPDRSRGEGDGSGAAPGNLSRLAAVRCGSGFQFGNAPFEILDPGAGAREHVALDFELLAGDQLKATQSLRQDIAKVGAQILVRLSQSWRNQRNKSQGKLVDVLPAHHGRRLELVDVESR